MVSHVRVLTLLVGMLLTCCGLALLCGLLGNPHGVHTVTFMAAEVGCLEPAPQVDLNCFSLIHRVSSPQERNFSPMHFEMEATFKKSIGSSCLCFSILYG